MYVIAHWRRADGLRDYGADRNVDERGLSAGRNPRRDSRGIHAGIHAGESTQGFAGIHALRRISRNGILSVSAVRWQRNGKERNI